MKVAAFNIKKNTFVLLRTVALVWLTSLAFIGGNSLAATPDGVTPANEGVCNGLQASGITPGLYGLCVAYCEAQDLDTFDKEPPSTKILANYNKRKQASDPAMPCVQPVCPCWTTAEMASITNGGAGACLSPSANTLRIVDNTLLAHFAEADTSSGRERCRYLDLTITPATVRSLVITPAEAQSCFTQVQAACTSVGF